MSHDTNESLARELATYIVNDSHLYSGQTQASINNLRRKIARGTYDAEKALVLWFHLATNGAEQYFREFNMSGHWYTYFPTIVRKLCAAELAVYYEEALRD